MTAEKRNLNQILNTLPSSPSLDFGILQIRTLLIKKIGQLLNGQSKTRYLTPDQSALLNRQLLISAAQIKATSNNGQIDEITESEAEHVLAKLFQNDLL